MHELLSVDLVDVIRFVSTAIRFITSIRFG